MIGFVGQSSASSYIPSPRTILLLLALLILASLFKGVAIFVWLSTLPEPPKRREAILARWLWPKVRGVPWLVRLKNLCRRVDGVLGEIVGDFASSLAYASGAIIAIAFLVNSQPVWLFALWIAVVFSAFYFMVDALINMEAC